MGIIANRLFVIVLFFLGSIILFAGPTPPPPNFKKPPPPPGLPIDDFYFVYGIIAVLYGIYIVYNNTKKENSNLN